MTSIQGCLPLGRLSAGGSAKGGLYPGGLPLEGGLPPGGLYPGGVCVQVGWADPLPTRTRKAGGVHPTGMLSCFGHFFPKNDEIETN